MQSNYNNMISKEKRMKVFRMLVIACVIFWIVIFMWQKTHESDITDAKATSFTISLERIAGISSTQMSYSQKKFLQLDDAAEVIKKSFDSLYYNFCNFINILSYVCQEFEKQ